MMREWGEEGRGDDRMALPPALREADEAHLRPHQQALLAALGREDWDRPIAMVIGPTGTGKTWAVAACMRAVRRLGRSARYWYVPDLIDRYRASQRPGEERETIADINGELARVWLLVLDDWGRFGSTDFAHDQLFRLVTTRINYRQPTIITSNLTEDDFKGVDPALHSRLFGRDADVSIFAGRDLRQE